MRHLSCIINFGYHLTATERLIWCKQLPKVKILEPGQAKLAVLPMFEKQHWKN